MPVCSKDEIGIMMIDSNGDGIVTSGEYVESALRVLRREALALTNAGRAVTDASFLSTSVTTTSAIQAQAENFRQNAPSTHSVIIERLSSIDAQRIADAAASMRASVREAGLFDRVAAGVELFVLNSDSRDRSYDARRRCEASR